MTQLSTSEVRTAFSGAINPSKKLPEGAELEGAVLKGDFVNRTVTPLNVSDKKHLASQAESAIYANCYNSGLFGQVANVTLKKTGGKPPIPVPRQQRQSPDDGLYMDMSGCQGARKPSENVYVNVLHRQKEPLKQLFNDVYMNVPLGEGTPLEQPSDNNLYMGMSVCEGAGVDEQEEPIYEVPISASSTVNDTKAPACEVPPSASFQPLQEIRLPTIKAVSKLSKVYQYTLSMGKSETAAVIYLSKPAHKLLRVSADISDSTKLSKAYQKRFKAIKGSEFADNRKREEINRALILLSVQCFNAKSARLVEKLQYFCIDRSVIQSAG